MGSFANRGWVLVLAWTSAAVVIGLNVWLAVVAIQEWLTAAGPWRIAVWLVTVPVAIGLLLLLIWIALEPLLNRTRKVGLAPITLPETGGAETGATPMYRRILVPLDHSDLDRPAISHAAAMARLYGAKLYLLHVEEGVTSQVYGPEASTAEVELGEQYLERIVESLRNKGITVEAAVSHGLSPKKEIARYARELRPDLVIMGAHGHGGLQDLIFGNTINPVRHDLDVPVLIVRPGKT